MPCDESVPLQRGSEGSLPTPALSSYSGDGEYDGYGDGYRDGYGDGYGDWSEFRASPHSRTPVQNLPAPLPSSLRPELTLGGGSPEPNSGLVSDSVAFCQPSHTACWAHTGGGDDGGGDGDAGCGDGGGCRGDGDGGGGEGEGDGDGQLPEAQLEP